MGPLPPLTAAFLEGRERDLLEPLRFLAPGERPTGGTAAVDRAPLAAGLAAANAAYGHPRAEELASRLADPETRVVVTGQQPGLYGGPLLTLTKMVAAVLRAEELEAAGEPAVAVFWVATEDHDWDEVARATVPGSDTLVDLELGEDPAPLLPVGMRTLGELLPAAEAAFAEALGPRGEEALEMLRRWYRPNARVGEAFCRLMVHLMGEGAPLMLDSILPEVKRAQRPWLERLVRERAAVDRELAAADQRVLERGFPLQVRPQEGLSPLFLLHGQERRRIAWLGEGRFGLRGLPDFSAPVESLLESIAENPSVVSPGVLARPAVQDAILGTTLQVMGPSETAYLAQAAGTYRALGLPGPWTSLRPQALVVEGRDMKHLEEYGLSLSRLLEEPLEQLVAELSGDDFVAPVREEVDRALAGLEAAVKALDPTLERPWRKTRANALRALDQLAGKVAAASARANEVRHRRLAKVLEACRPEGKAQERTLAVAYFLARWGPAFSEAMLDQLGLDPRHVHLIEM